MEFREYTCMDNAYFELKFFRNERSYEKIVFYVPDLFFHVESSSFSIVSW